MEKEIILRENHKELMDREAAHSYKIYVDDYNETIKQLNFIDDLLKDIPGKILVTPDSNSWYNHKIELAYKNIIFQIGSDFKGKLQTHSKELYKNHSATIYIKEKEEFIKNNKPLEYTFYKLTTKKLLEVLDYYIKLIELCNKLSTDKEKTNLDIYDQKKDQINFIAKTLKQEAKEIKDDNNKEVVFYAPFGRLEVIYNYFSKSVSFSYDIDKYLNIIKILKEA